MNRMVDLSSSLREFLLEAMTLKIRCVKAVKATSGSSVGEPPRPQWWWWARRASKAGLLDLRNDRWRSVDHFQFRILHPSNHLGQARFKWLVKGSSLCLSLEISQQVALEMSHQELGVWLILTIEMMASPGQVSGWWIRSIYADVLATLLDASLIFHRDFQRCANLGKFKAKLKTFWCQGQRHHMGPKSGIKKPHAHAGYWTMPYLWYSYQVWPIPFHTYIILHPNCFGVPSPHQH